MKMIYKAVASAALATLTVLGTPANAATVVTSGSLTNADPVFNSPNEGNPPTTIAIGNYSFDAYRFTLSSNGSYALTAASTAFDTYLGLYQGAFDPKNPLLNALEYNDDSAGSLNSLISRSLTTGVNYFAVVTSFATGATGAYTLSVSGPGTTTIGGAVPEPATWAMMILGMGAVGYAMRRRIKVSEVNFTNKVRAIAAS
jgi:hypothetical protein